ncbi:hypothetical protein CQ010_01210 [Arthrobacter sp. MYb211]|uniref:AAA family ATPase n=1 Tax=unclassified Arthrobacter TaxID=235627 RepID=UPI000CFCDFA9|nr:MULTISPECIES: AAA family ATPase [unclassified Arthrobacter]PRA13292.1 hypothetical protein CQ015_03465 [Arthrobacter sp. MYb221]PRC10489.1 hypothetical protein CQ010_01210 [Arthrobacter sp. MYb211]
MVTPNQQRLVGLKVENFKRLRTVDIEFTENTVIISGRNEQGKSSVLDAILWALGGGAAAKKMPNPIHNGETKATVEVVLDDFIITRTAAVDRKASTLTVTSRDGVEKYSSPQKLLDGLIGKLSFDPLEFSRMKDTEQRAVLLDCVELGIDLNANEAEREVAYKERTFVNREVKSLEAQYKAIEAPAEVPAQVDVGALMQELTASQKAHTDAAEAVRTVSSLEAQLADLQDRLAAAREKSLEALSARDAHRDPDDIQEQITGSTEANKAGELIRQKESLGAQFKAKAAEAKALDKKIEDLDKAKADALAKAEMPIEGLGIDETGVTYQGQPLSQASGAGLTKVSTAMAVSLNPGLRLAYIREGSLLDTENLQIIRDIADAMDFMILVEVVDESGEIGIVIEDGMVAGDPEW